MNGQVFTITLAALIILTDAARAAPLSTITSETSIKARADGAISFLTYSVLPDTTLSTISINSSGDNDTDIALSQIGGAFTWSSSFPLYLEGYLGFARYDPQFVMSDGVHERDVPAKWNSIATTIGIGWDFQISEHWVFRPIINGSLGHIESDASLFQRFVNYKTNADIEFLEGGKMNAAGYGASAMLDYELHKPNYETDLEIRYTQIHLESIGDTSTAVKGTADAKSLNVWGRLRIPTGAYVLRRPLRYVFEISQSELLDNGAEELGMSHLTKLGTGLEVDLSDAHVIATRLRLIGRYVFGPNVSGFSVGLGISF